jgi:hypothetical protein
VAVPILKPFFLSKKWQNGKIWGEIFVILQTHNNKNIAFDEKTQNKQLLLMLVGGRKYSYFSHNFRFVCFGISCDILSLF